MNAADNSGGSRGQRVTWIAWLTQVAVAAILVQTLYFKFTYAPETQVIFENRGGRMAATAVGLLELVAAILLLPPRTAPFGALLALGLMAGAIFTHLTSLGIEVAGDGGLLFGLALAVTAGSLVVLAIRRRQVTGIIHALWLSRAPSTMVHRKS
jgi:uncharacterized membrane protein YphA (DoxX/SURF4 family)